MEQFEKNNHLTAGQMLAEARERLQLSQLEIAKALRLKIKSIAELESDDYHEFRAAVYVKGYLRRYAEIVQLDEKAVLANFNPVGFKVNLVNHNEKTSGPIKIQKAPILSREKSISGIIIVVVLVAVVIGINWYKHDKTLEVAKATQTALPVSKLETLASTTAAEATVTDLTVPSNTSAPAVTEQSQTQAGDEALPAQMQASGNVSQAQTQTNDDTSQAQAQAQTQVSDNASQAQVQIQASDDTSQ